MLRPSQRAMSPFAKILFLAALLFALPFTINAAPLVNAPDAITPIAEQPSAIKQVLFIPDEEQHSDATTTDDCRLQRRGITVQGLQADAARGRPAPPRRGLAARPARTVAKRAFAATRARLRKAVKMPKFKKGGFKGLRGKMGAGLKGLRGKVGGGLKGLRGKVGAGLKGLRGKVGFGLKGLRGKMGAGLKGLRGKMGAGLKGLRGKVGGGWKGLRGKMGAGLKGLRGKMGAGFKGLRGKVGAGLKGLRGNLGAGLKGLRSKMGAGLKGLHGKMGAGLKGLRGKMGAGLKGLRLKMKIRGLKGGLKGLRGKMGAGLKGLRLKMKIRGLKGGLKGLRGKMGAGLKGLRLKMKLRGLKGGLKGLRGKIGSGLKGLRGKMKIRGLKGGLKGLRDKLRLRGQKSKQTLPDGKKKKGGRAASLVPPPVGAVCLARRDGSNNCPTSPRGIGAQPATPTGERSQQRPESPPAADFTRPRGRVRAQAQPGVWEKAKKAMSETGFVNDLVRVGATGAAIAAGRVMDGGSGNVALDAERGYKAATVAKTTQEAVQETDPNKKPRKQAANWGQWIGACLGFGASCITGTNPVDGALNGASTGKAYAQGAYDIYNTGLKVSGVCFAFRKTVCPNLKAPQAVRDGIRVATAAVTSAVTRNPYVGGTNTGNVIAATDLKTTS
ncbi:hypothetical protein HDU96_001751, partial [Phlyctochytrium bullatum]